MRGQARQARRNGLQPMMVINTGEPFLETVDAVLLRWAWPDRSQLAPLDVTAAIVAAPWWSHATRGAQPTIAYEQTSTTKTIDFLLHSGRAT